MAASSLGSTKVHPISEAGFGAGKSELYDKLRPGYAPEVLSHIRKAANKKEGLKIVEIGSGTGIFTRGLLTHPEWSSTISELRCIDPNEGMRSVFTKTVEDTRVSLSNGTFDDTGVSDNWADLIVSASAFHWCSDLESAIHEFIRILKNDGTICFVWNIQDKKNFAWIKQMSELSLPYQKGTASSPEEIVKWRRLFDLSSYKDNFLTSDEVAIASTERGTLESVTLYAFTKAGVAIISDEEKQKLRESIKNVVERGDDLVWVNKKEGILEVPYMTQIVIMQRK